MDAYSPFPIEELTEAIGFRHTRLPLIVLIGGIIGCIGGFALCYWVSAITYPLNIGGRPLLLLLRETPLHLGHLKLMVQVAEYGAIVFPAVAGTPGGTPVSVRHVPVDFVIGSSGTRS